MAMVSYQNLSEAATSAYGEKNGLELGHNLPCSMFLHFISNSVSVLFCLSRTDSFHLSLVSAAATRPPAHLSPLPQSLIHSTHQPSSFVHRQFVIVAVKSFCYRSPVCVSPAYRTNWTRVNCKLHFIQILKLSHCLLDSLRLGPVSAPRQLHG